ncbi:4Fe-4S binding protein [Salidesulfovibrio onnuriiensis]|uniref:4Fe-4S binding protein n=1 Tax=Salidesulfovibrio onnuriiensis TaxID=2583823 RepID=UPI0011C975CC|nr:4Fe-4S binding protein [Salidesulfovibrio onnuriiensis]
MPLIKQSTRDYWNEAKREGLTFWERVHGYIYARWAFHYIGIAKGRHKLLTFLLIPAIWLLDRHSPFKGAEDARPGDQNQKRPSFADTYHGKAIPLETATKLVNIGMAVNTELPEQVIPYTRARRIILENPARIAVLDCPCRSASKNPCLPLDVCLIMGDPMVSFILEHHPGRSREIDAAEAERILKQCNARGNVAHAFFKDVMLSRFYAICNCCSCCCGAMQAHKAGCHMLTSSGYLAEVDEEKCVSCGQCAQYCQFKAIGFRKGSAFIRPKRCMGCGVCVDKCNKGALSLRLAPEKGMPLEVDKLGSVSPRQ